jgi:hypothetical protein
MREGRLDPGAMLVMGATNDGSGSEVARRRVQGGRRWPAATPATTNAQNCPTAATRPYKLERGQVGGKSPFVQPSGSGYAIFHRGYANQGY